MMRPRFPAATVLGSRGYTRNFLAQLMRKFCCWFFFFLVTGSREVVSRSQPSSDWRVVTYEDLHMMASTHMFERKEFTDYATFGLDLIGDQMIVGIRDNLLRFRLSDLSLVEVVPWLSDESTVIICLSKGQSKGDCHNFIRVLIIRENRVFVCGTNSYSPQCSWRKLDSLNAVESWVTGVAKSPYSPHQNSTSLMTTDGNFYSATVTDFTGRDAAIYRMMGPARHLRTAQYNSRWLNEPDFVSAYDIGDYVYFFLREVAVEYINCGKAIYSRVARICKNDSGGKVLLEDNWTTFLKARLNCSLPGNYPFYFSELQSTYYDKELKLIFAVFTTSPTSIYGSAVCIYNMTSFELAFAGSFKYQENAQSAWNRAPNNNSSIQCSRGMAQGKKSSENIISSHQHLVDVQKFQMMDSAVSPSNYIPPLLAENERWTHIVTDRVRVLFQSVHTEVIVLFIATLEGIIKKFFLLPQPINFNGSTISVCLLEELHLMPSDRPQPIRQLEIVRLHNFLLVGTANRLYQIPTHRCNRFTSKLLCQNMQDPYCQWNDEVQKCQGTGNKNLTSCPQLHFPVDGGWSSWSAWQPCSSPATLAASDHSERRDDTHKDLRCLCRSRMCDDPAPSNGGSECYGQSMQVINCTENKKIKKEENTKMLNGEWSAWNEWTSCSSVCGVGHQTRFRDCKKPPESSKKTRHHCQGARKEMRACEVRKCSELRNKSNSWSQWYMTESTKDGFHEERVRCVCDSVAPGGQQLDASFMLDSRFCSLSSRNCTDSENRINISLVASSLCSGDECEKTSITKKQENSVDKEMPESGITTSGKIQASPKSMNRRLTQRSAFPLGQTVSYGYCGCRDLGMFRICYRCRLP